MHKPIITIVAMSVQPFDDVILEEVNVYERQKRLTISMTVSLKMHDDMLALCERIQKQVIDDIYEMTGKEVVSVHLYVHRLVDGKNA
ncbi:Asp23/Gls24 family envelope stress response protein [Anoxybacillus flavithermus]|nr:Asp23/Gls24 family envelope stress response protein [Anoxybacillus flavithermus]